jgi:hypothetical protein
LYIVTPIITRKISTIVASISFVPAAPFVSGAKVDCGRRRVSAAFRSAAELERILMAISRPITHFIPQQAIGHQFPVEALQSRCLGQENPASVLHPPNRA